MMRDASLIPRFLPVSSRTLAVCPFFDKLLSKSNLDPELQQHPQVFFFFQPHQNLSAAIFLVLSGRRHEANATRLLPTGSSEIGGSPTD